MTIHEDPPAQPGGVKVRRTRWNFQSGECVPGYRIQRNGRFLWLHPEEAYEVCCALADLINADAEMEATE